MPLDASQIAFAKDLLKAFRDERRPRLAHEQVGTADAVLTLVTTIEARAPKDELWTSSPEAAEITGHSPLGDHLYITRRHFGLTA
jgi:hypothetical protein